MFSIFNKKESLCLGEILQVDMHSHILPGIDEAAPDVKTSMRLTDGVKLNAFLDRNCFFKCNALSFTGYYGKREQNLAFRLLDAGLIDYIGSDAHHDRHLEHLKKFTVSSKVAKQLESLNHNNLELH